MRTAHRLRLAAALLLSLALAVDGLGLSSLPCPSGLPALSGGRGRAEAAPAVPPIRLVVNGRELSPDTPPLLVEGRVLVPVRLISEALGAQVAWVAAEGRVELSLGDRSVLLTVGRDRAMVNGVEVPLDVPARVVGGRTLVPLRFLGESLGAQVRWEAETRTVRVDCFRVTAIRWERAVGRGRLVVEVGGPATFRVAAVGPPEGTWPRLVLDLDASLSLAQTVIPIQDGDVMQVRAGLMSTAPDLTRVIVDLQEPVRYWASRSPDGREVWLEIGYKVTRVAWEPRPGGQALVIYTTGPLEWQAAELLDPPRLAIDLEGATLAQGVPASSKPAAEAADVLLGVRTGQFRTDPDAVRVVLDLRRPTGYRVLAWSGGLEVFLSAEVAGVSWEARPDRVRVVVAAPRPLVCSTLLLEDPLRLVIDIPHATVEGGPLTWEVNRGPLKKVVMAQFQRNPDVVRVVLHLAYHAGAIPVEVPSGLAFDLPVSFLYGRRVVIDPGHGGQDPGAIGPAGTREKEVNLAVCLILRELLSSQGAEVIMTREDDSAVELADRPALANRVGADAMLSVHANAFWIDSRQGFEVYYYASHGSSRRLAQAIHAEMAALGLNDRGVRTERFVVLREARVPAALVEAAFLSNPDEERLLLDPAFHRRLAEALARGLARFFAP
ncbi:MAG: N-acetylmuramoyl-L-alanine amidase family protein [Acetobacteraceae bacterium]|nr:N-acetylmuramoyl-L-alanine amidase family protein [Acetobacteraceae bacterium]